MIAASLVGFISLAILYWKYITQPRVIADIVIPQMNKDGRNDFTYIDYGVYKNSRGEIYDFRTEGGFMRYLFG
jgi:hypothetical protein